MRLQGCTGGNLLWEILECRQNVRLTILLFSAIRVVHWSSCIIWVLYYLCYSIRIFGLESMDCMADQESNTDLRRRKRSHGRCYRYGVLQYWNPSELIARGYQTVEKSKVWSVVSVSEAVWAAFQQIAFNGYKAWLSAYVLSYQYLAIINPSLSGQHH